MKILSFLSWIVLYFWPAGASIIRGPTNIARVSGTNVTMECVITSNNDSIDWYYVGLGHMKTTRSKIVNQKTSKQADNQFSNSILLEAVDLHTAGRYFCTVMANGTTAETQDVGCHLIVLESDPVCSISRETSKEEYYIQLQCSVNYSGEWDPVMEWRLNGSKKTHEVSNISVRTNNAKINNITQLTSFLYILPSESYQEPVYFYCNTFFNYSKDLMIHSIASNIPSYSNTWESPAINVPYGVRNITISPIRDILYPEDILTCSSLGYPKPEYKWSNVATNEVTIGCQLRINSTMIREQPFVFRCTANNSLSISFLEVTFTVQSRFSSVNIAAIIAVTICSSLIIALSIVIILIYVAGKKKKKKREFNSLAEAREHSEPNPYSIGMNEDAMGEYVELTAAGIVMTEVREPSSEIFNSSNLLTTEIPVSHSPVPDVAIYARIDHTLIEHNEVLFMETEIF